jgi:hypothetical protein
MKLLAKAAPFILVRLGCAQSPMDHEGRKIDYGFTTSTFAGSSINYIASNFLEKKDVYSYLPISRPNATFSNFGWKQGIFVWVNLSERFSYKAQCDIVFGVNQFRYINENLNTYCRFFGVEYKPQLIIKLGRFNRHPLVKLAKDMSYYMTGRQTYLVIGPKFCYSKPDRYFLKENNIKYSSAGMMFGIGTDNLFPNMDFAPELIVSAEYKTGRRYGDPYDPNRYYFSLSLAVNFF